MKWPNLEGAEILYSNGWKFDKYGPGTICTIQKKETKKDSSGSVVEILFPKITPILRQSLSLDVFIEGVNKEEIEITNDENCDLHRWRVWERELLNKPFNEAVKEVESFSGDELANLIKLLKERIEGKTRLNREEAVFLLGKLGELTENAKEVSGVFDFLLEQTEVRRSPIQCHKVSNSSLREKGRLRREECGVAAKCLRVATEIARKKNNEEMSEVVRSTANRLKTHSSQILKRTAKAVLKNL